MKQTKTSVFLFNLLFCILLFAGKLSAQGGYAAGDRDSFLLKLSEKFNRLIVENDKTGEARKKQFVLSAGEEVQEHIRLKLKRDGNDAELVMSRYEATLAEVNDYVAAYNEGQSQYEVYVYVEKHNDVDQQRIFDVGKDQIPDDLISNIPNLNERSNASSNAYIISTRTKLDNYLKSLLESSETYHTGMIRVLIGLADLLYVEKMIADEEYPLKVSSLFSVQFKDGENPVEKWDAEIADEIIAGLQSAVGSNAQLVEFVVAVFGRMGEVASQTPTDDQTDYKLLIKQIMVQNDWSEIIYNNQCNGSTGDLPNKFCYHAILNNGIIDIKLQSYFTFPPSNIPVHQYSGITQLQNTAKFLIAKKDGVWKQLQMKDNLLVTGCANIYSLLGNSTNSNENKQLYFEIKGENQPNPLFSKIQNAVQQKLNNDFYKDVVACVRIHNNENDVTLRHADNQGKPCDIIIDIELLANGNVKTAVRAGDDYLSEYVNNVQALADGRGIETNAESLRQIVIADLESSSTNQSFYNTFIQEVNALLEEKVGGFTEALIVSQKIAKNVWGEGTINKSIWHSTGEEAIEHLKWPVYTKTGPLLGGGLDGVIDEVVGIRMAIMGIYGIITDEQQRNALTGIFTQEGFGQLIQGIATEAHEIYNDNERSQHFGAQTGVSVAAGFFGVGIITGSGKITGTLQTLTNNIDQLTQFPKLTRFLEDVKKVGWYDEALKIFQKQFDELIEKMPISPASLDNMARHTSIESFKVLIEKLHKLKDVPGIEKVIKDLSSAYYPKFKGAKFVVDYGVSLIETGKIIAFEVSDLSDELKRIYDITIDELVGGNIIKIKIELKNWKRFYPSTIKNQFVKDLAKMEELGRVKWLFNKGGEVSDLETLKGKVLSSLKKADGSPVDELIENLDELKVKRLFPEDELINETNYASRLLRNIDKDENFVKIFQIVE